VGPWQSCEPTTGNQRDEQGEDNADDKRDPEGAEKATDSLKTGTRDGSWAEPITKEPSPLGPEEEGEHDKAQGDYAKDVDDIPIAPEECRKERENCNGHWHPEPERWIQSNHVHSHYLATCLQ
jgi:hypothetical protein